MATLEAIQTKIKKLQTQAEAIVVKQASATLDRIRDLMEKHGLTISDIEKHLRGRKHDVKATDVAGRGKQAAAVSERKPLVKYMNPKTGETWSGRGRAPHWIAKARNRSKFLVGASDEAAASVPAAAKVKRGTKRVGKVATKGKLPRRKASSAATAPAPKGQPKGKQPAKYRNPETGATWSGRGPAPAWLAAEKDRSKFLIGKTGENSA